MRFNALITFFSVTRARHLITKTICTKLGAREWLNLEQGTGYATDGILRLQQSIGALFSIQKPALAYHEPVKSFVNLKLMISSTWRPQCQGSVILFFVLCSTRNGWNCFISKWQFSRGIERISSITFCLWCVDDAIFRLYFFRVVNLRQLLMKSKTIALMIGFCFQICYPL